MTMGITLAMALADPASGARPAEYLRGFAQARSIIESSANRCLLLELWLAETSAQHRQGLMHIEQLDEAEGMLFIYDRDATVSMWMKNTRLPLDMLFIRGDGEIVRIARRTEPMSTRSISSGAVVRFVLELDGGATERWQIEPGNRLLTIN
ncbi:MAG: DUF192 domain-containing protein [Gammaproteobacteria bacterium]